MGSSPLARRSSRTQGVSLDAIKYHVANALQKLGVSSRAELRIWNGVRRDSNLFKMELQMSQPSHLALWANSREA